MSEITLCNEKIGASIQVRLRPFRPEDAPAMVRCIRGEYEDTYFKRDFYTPENLVREHESGHITFLAAELVDGPVIGMLALKRFLPREDMCEIASQIFLPEYRGFHMAWPFFLYGMERMALMEGVSAAYCLPVLFHAVTQILMERLGLVPTGFFFGVFLMEQIHHSYPRDSNRKHPQGIMVMKQKKDDAGVLYLPPVHHAFAEGTYRDLGAAVRFAPGARELMGESELFFTNDPLQHSCHIHVDRGGADLVSRVREIMAQHPVPEQTFNLSLNASDESAVAAYEALLPLGFFFSGLQPLCSGREILALHHCGGTPICLEELYLTPKFRAVAQYVAPFYEGRVINP